MLIDVKLTSIWFGLKRCISTLPDIMAFKPVLQKITSNGQLNIVDYYLKMHHVINNSSGLMSFQFKS